MLCRTRNWCIERARPRGSGSVDSAPKTSETFTAGTVKGMFLRRTNFGWEACARAKLNLYLEVLGRRPDGFHELETLVVPVQLYDTLAWETLPATAAGRPGEVDVS